MGVGSKADMKREVAWIYFQRSEIHRQGEDTCCLTKNVVGFSWPEKGSRMRLSARRIQIGHFESSREMTSLGNGDRQQQQTSHFKMADLNSPRRESQPGEAVCSWPFCHQINMILLRCESRTALQMQTRPEREI